MIVTVTANPSIDQTLYLPGYLERDSVHRLTGHESVAGGKGINVSVALHKAGIPTRAVFPARSDDLFVSLLSKVGVDQRRVDIEGQVRTNVTLCEPDGTTTKLNESGAHLSESERQAFEDAIIKEAQRATTVVFAGSLPPGLPSDWYALMVRRLRAEAPDVFICVDTSDKPLQDLAASFPETAPDLIKPNAFELGQILGIDGNALETAGKSGSYEPVIDAAQELQAKGVKAALITLGAAGALLVSPEGSFIATPPPTDPVSTVGAGDSSLAGFLRGRHMGSSMLDCAAMAVAYGSAATGLPGTTIPAPDQINLEQTAVREL
ncbi:MAG: 1-phosphofructokinase family hexose kinase, partial [Corynebacterium pyruviciproducens]|uniref:1-phosphofructokinase family hexose kinase n=1 Tax=Corynebacterium pyruviciproducens TaxID=598660 RepID=UPI003982E684